MNPFETTRSASLSSLRADAAANLGDLKTRYADVFAVPARRLATTLTVVAIMLGLAAFAMVQLEFSLERILKGAHRLGQFAILMFPPLPQGLFLHFAWALGETLAIAFVGTMLAAVMAFPIAFLAAKNVMPNIFVRFPVRRGLDVVRSVDTLIWALMWINVVGLGPFAGALAIACADFGAFGKLFSEAIEATETRASEGVAASGGSRLHQVRFGILPQVLPVMASQVLYFFESNTRSATIIGIVGAGGVGIYLTELIRVLELQKVAFLIGMILITVALIDFISARLRMALIGKAAR